VANLTIWTNLTRKTGIICTVRYMYYRYRYTFFKSNLTSSTGENNWPLLVVNYILTVAVRYSDMSPPFQLKQNRYSFLQKVTCSVAKALFHYIKNKSCCFVFRTADFGALSIKERLWFMCKQKCLRCNQKVTQARLFSKKCT
jgi:hypothetical protein